MNLQRTPNIHIIPVLATLLLALPCFAVANDPATPAVPHCEVPCGVYDDQMRFEQMLEDTETIAKSIAAINEFANDPAAHNAKGINQVSRWVMTKENHATNTQHIAAQYFLTQRIKPENERYVDQLKAAHAVMLAAMKCKQDADAATAEALRNAIYDLYRAYEGKEPQLHQESKEGKQ